MNVAQSTKFWDNVAERYSKKPVPDEAVYQKKLAVTREYLQPHMEVLEIGCGTGSTAIAHAPYVKHIRATDISAKMIGIARAKVEAQNIENVTFEQVAIDELDVPAESLDAVLGLSILHLLENKEEAIAEVHRMLKPGGAFITSTVCLGDTMKFFKVIGPIGRFLGLMPLVRVFTARELVDSLTNDGLFEIDYQWRPGKGKNVDDQQPESKFMSSAVFIVAKKAD